MGNEVDKNELPLNLTQLANAARTDPDAANEFLTKVYGVVRQIARQEMGADRSKRSMDPTELANAVIGDMLQRKASDAETSITGELPISLPPESVTGTMPSNPVWINRDQMLAGFRTRMRNKLIDLWKAGRRKKRGSGKHALSLSNENLIIPHATGPSPLEVMAVHEALADLQRSHPNAYSILVLRNSNRSFEQIAEELKVTSRTVRRRWQFAISYLADVLGDGPLSG